MDEVEKRIVLYMFSSIMTTILVYLDVMGFKNTWDPEFIVLLNGIIGSVISGVILMIRYKFKIKVNIPGVSVPDDVIPDEPVTPT